MGLVRLRSRSPQGGGLCEERFERTPHSQPSEVLGRALTSHSVWMGAQGFPQAVIGKGRSRRPKAKQTFRFEMSRLLNGHIIRNGRQIGEHRVNHKVIECLS